MHWETLWGDGHKQHASPSSPHASRGEGSAAPYLCSSRERFHPSSLTSWVLTAPRVPGSCLSITGEVGWLRSFLWPGFSQVFADHPDPEEQLTALTKDPNALSRQEVPLLQLFTTALQPDAAGWFQPSGAQFCAPASTAQSLDAKVGSQGRERYQKLLSSTSLWSYFSALSGVGCLGGEGGCWQWDVTIRRVGLGFSDTIF